MTSAAALLQRHLIYLRQAQDFEHVISWAFQTAIALGPPRASCICCPPLSLVHVASNKREESGEGAVRHPRHPHPNKASGCKLLLSVIRHADNTLSGDGEPRSRLTLGS